MLSYAAEHEARMRAMSAALENVHYSARLAALGHGECADMLVAHLLSGFLKRAGQGNVHRALATDFCCVHGVPLFDLAPPNGSVAWFSSIRTFFLIRATHPALRMSILATFSVLPPSCAASQAAVIRHAFRCIGYRHIQLNAAAAGHVGDPADSRPVAHGDDAISPRRQHDEQERAIGADMQYRTTGFGRNRHIDIREVIARRHREQEAQAIARRGGLKRFRLVLADAACHEEHAVAADRLGKRLAKRNA